MYFLTEEGKKYLKSKLPELRLVELCKGNKHTVGELKQKMKDFSIGIQWAKKNGWIKIVNNFIIVENIPETIPEMYALDQVDKNIKIDEKMIKLLESRNLIKKASEKKEITGEILNLTSDIIKNKLWEGKKFKKYNTEAPGKKIYPGKIHPYNRFLRKIRERLVDQGFIEIKGNAIELEFWNFDALYQPQNHPSREWTDTYSMKTPIKGKLPSSKIVNNVKAAHENGWKTKSTGWQYKWSHNKASKLMPVAHDTFLSPKVLASKELKIPGKYFQIVRCYRPDVIDATHGVEFNQMGGMVIEKNLTFRDLLGLLEEFAELAGVKKIKFFPDYYPFTEPSVQISGKHPEMGWIEFAGAGIFRPELTEPLGIKDPVIAWGFGIDRLAMYKLGVKDIRNIFTQNLKLLREWKNADN